MQGFDDAARKLSLGGRVAPPWSAPFRVVPSIARLVKVASLATMALSTILLAAPAQAGRTVDFEFNDETYVLPKQHRGGRAYVPKQVSADDPVPLVVFLHGVNRRRQLHPWLKRGRGTDLRPLLEQWIEQGDVPPAVIAGPSQTRDAAWGSRLWTGFELDAFVEATEQAMAGRAHVARDQVIVAGHSGAGCNASGGLLKIAADRGSIRPLGIVAIDTCLDAGVGEALARASDETRIATYWQSVVWDRRFAEFAIGFELTRSESPPGTDWFDEVDPIGRRPHDALVAPSLMRALSVLLPVPGTNGALVEAAAAPPRL
jgi:hypothetical protein